MVDVDSALRASAYSGKKKPRDGGRDERISTTLEPFEPANHASKEKADALSMWLMITFGLLVALLMRYYFMPTLEQTEQALWLLPVLLIFTLKPLHKATIPSNYYDLYTRGNWFRAGFLYLFTWLALSFAIVNPPLADIAPPHVADGIDIEFTDGIAGYTWSNSVYDLSINQDSIQVVLGLAVRDNLDVTDSNISITITQKGQSEPLVSLQGIVQNQVIESQQFENVSQWNRGLWTNQLSNRVSDNPEVAPNDLDYGMAWNLGDLGPGDYTISVKMDEDGAPWSTGKNYWSQEYKLLISQVA